MTNRVKFIIGWAIAVVLIFFALFYVNECKAQLYTETFSNFVPVKNDSTVGFWIFDSVYEDISGTALNEDYSDSTNDLTINGWADIAAMRSQCTRSSPMYSGGKTLVFDGTAANDLSIAAASATDFAFGSRDWTLEVVVSPDDAPSGGGGIVSKAISFGSGTDGAWLLVVNDAASDRIDAKIGTGVSTNISVIGEQWGSVWQYIAYWRDGDTLRTIVSEVWSIGQRGGINADPGDINGDNTTPRNLVIGNIQAALSPFEGSIAWAMISYGVRTDRQRREAVYLANGWSSVSGNVTREHDGTIWDFHQGFYNSEIVYEAMGLTKSISTLGDSTWVVHVDAKGTKAGDVMSVWLGSPTNKIVPQIDVTLSATSTTKVLTFRDVALTATDAIVFQASESDSIYIDNINLYRGYSQQAARGKRTNLLRLW